MASEIRVNKINSRTGVGTITLSPTGVDFTGIATVATLKATTGIVTTLTATTGIVTTLTVDTTRTTTGIVTTLTADTSRITTGIVTTLTADTAKVGAAVTISESGMEVTGVTTVTSSINIGTGTSITSSSLIVNDVQYPTAGALGNRNLIINGGMTVAQRGTSVTGIGVDDYTCCDRFKNFAALSGQAGRLTATQENITDLAGFNKALKLQVTTTETPGSTESYGLNTRLELQDVKKLDIGTSAAVPLTLSFYAKAPTGNGVFCAGIIMPGGGSYIEEVTIGTSWSRHEINIPATTNSSHATTQTNDTHSGMEIQITLMAGSSRDDHGNGTWEADTANRATSNQSNFFSSTSNNLFVTGVQLERGEKATPFEHRSYGDELAMCQRYYVDLGIGGRFGPFVTGANGTNGYFGITLPVTMRAAPSLVYDSLSDFTVNNYDASNVPTSFVIDQASTAAVGLRHSGGSGVTYTKGNTMLFYSDASGDKVAFNADL